MHSDSGPVFARLVGTWSGRGIASYPDVGTFHYLERLVFTNEPDWGMLSVLQHTWQVDDGRQGKGLHIEAGIIRAHADGRLEYSCAQDSGRTEVMFGTVFFAGDLVQIDWVTTAHANDERLIKMGRTWHVGSKQLGYEAHIATKRTPDYRQHLEAKLLRQPR